MSSWNDFFIKNSKLISHIYNQLKNTYYSPPIENIFGIFKYIPLDKIKVVMVGDLAVGKTSIAGRLLGNDFESSYRATVGATFLSLERTIQNVQCIINLWDTAGQENFRSLLSMYARETQGALIVCDVTREDTFNHIKDWIDFIKDATPSAQLVLLANKIDLVSERVVTPENFKVLLMLIQ